jgi:23S rRNA (pseudouridine1915-N3)-methyltransferase
MRLSIAAIGQGRQSPEQKLAEGWFSKLPHQGKLIECVSKIPPGPRRCADESARLLAAFPDQALVVAMDSGGRDMSSEELANFISSHRDRGVRDAVFAVGGADGHSPEFLANTDTKIAFGRQTWPHMLFRAMLAEQLFRAEMILAGHPYHHV